MNKVQFCKNYIFNFFSRVGGVSKGDFSSLNCAHNKGDSSENVEKNRIIASNQLNKKKIIIPNQTHSNIVLQVDKKIDNLGQADAIITSRDDILLGILTADCAPIIIMGKKNYGIIHAGWRGLLGGIVENTVNKFLSLKEKESDLNVYVGPHLKKESFEIQNDFIQKIKKNINHHERFIVSKQKKKYFDFSKLIETTFLRLNIINYNISNENTFAYPKRFFSHRYCFVNKIKNCGRQISLVGINK